MAAKNTSAPVNIEMLKWARAALRMNKETAALKLAVHLDVLLSWENGVSRPSFSELRKIANVYKVSVPAFFLPEPPEYISVPPDFRTLAGSEQSLSTKALVEIVRAGEKRETLLELYESMKRPIPIFKARISGSEDPESLALVWREVFGLGLNSDFAGQSEYDAYNFWRTNIEDQGVVVFQATSDSLEEFRGITLFHTSFPIIISNSKDAVRGRIFTLLHEFCHVLMHISGVGNMTPNAASSSPSERTEVFCNAFAGACLLPNHALRAHPDALALHGRVTLERVAVACDRIGRRFQVSWEVVLRRLLSSGLIESQQYEHFRNEIAKTKSSVIKHDGFAPWTTRQYANLGGLFVRTVLDANAMGKITRSDVSSLLGVKLNHLDQIQSRAKQR